MRRGLLRAVHCPGIRSDSLGSYFTGLGLLAALSEKGRNVRACWREGVFVALGETLSRTTLEEDLSAWQPRPYQRWWYPHQRADTKTRGDRNVWTARNSAPIDQVKLLDSHIVGVDRNYFNPVFGSGGNIAKRNIARVYEEAKRLLAQASAEQRLQWLRATLFQENEVELPELRGAGTWFVYANKTFNSGQDWYREGQISPWSFLLALEGARLLAGGTSRRSSAARRYAVFPFVSPSAPADAAQDSDAGRAEFWAPLWIWPATLATVQALLARGQARVRNKAASAPYEFALAARTAGVDAGVSEFARFALRRTTSRQTYEAVPQERIAVSDKDEEILELAKLTGWINRLPRDNPQDGGFYGIRGQIERALIRLAENPDDEERWRAFLLLLADSQAQIDRNKELRETCLAIPLLDGSLMVRAWPTLRDELKIARAIASIGQGSSSIEEESKRSALVQANIYGVDGTATPQFPTKRPNRVVWSDTSGIRSMANVLERRLLDTEPLNPIPLNATRECSRGVIHTFLDGALDLEQVARWIPPLSLLRWSVNGGRTLENEDASLNGVARLHDLFRPLLHPRVLKLGEDSKREEKVTATTARQLVKLIRQESWGEAIALARSRYLAAGHGTVDPPPDIQCEGDRVAAALLIPMNDKGVIDGFKAWLNLERKENR